MSKSHRFVRNYVHLVFSTLGRRPTIDHGSRAEFAELIRGVAANLGAATLACNGWTDHMHGLVTPPPNLALSEFVGRLKSNTSRLANKRNLFEADGFRWARGYGAFSLGAQDLPRVIRYIERQEIRHASQALDDEFRLLAERGQLSDAEAEYFFRLGLDGG